MEQDDVLDPETAQILKAMQERDRFGQWMGLVVDECREGYCKLHYTIRDDMVNAFGNMHGGIVFSAADSAFSMACNAYGRFSMSLDTHVTFMRPARPGETLFVEAREVHTGFKTCFYAINTTNEKGDLVSSFSGTGYRSDKNCLDLLGD